MKPFKWFYLISYRRRIRVSRRPVPRSTAATVALDMEKAEAEAEAEESGEPSRELNPAPLKRSESGQICPRSRLRPVVRLVNGPRSRLRPALHLVHALRSRLRPALHLVHALRSRLRPALHLVHALRSRLCPALHLVHALRSRLCPARRDWWLMFRQLRQPTNRPQSPLPPTQE